MAYVAISGELEASVREGIRAMARKELASIGEVPRLKGTEPFVEKAIWGEYVALKPQLPKAWKTCVDRVVLRIHMSDGAVWQETVFFQNEQEGPPGHSCYNPAKAVVSADDPDARALAEIASNRLDAQKRWQDVEQNVLAFLRKCKSLNEGLKLWPDLRMYIPPHYLTRIERKVERPKDSSTAALDVLKNMDTNQIVAAAVIARMSNTGNES